VFLVLVFLRSSSHLLRVALVTFTIHSSYRFSAFGASVYERAGFAFLALVTQFVSPFYFCSASFTVGLEEG